MQKEKKARFFELLPEDPEDIEYEFQQMNRRSTMEMPKFRPNRLAKILAREKVAQEANNIKISSIHKILNADGDLDISFFESGLDIQPKSSQNFQKLSVSYSPGQEDFDTYEKSSDSDLSDIDRQEVDYPSNGGEEEEEDIDNPQYNDDSDHFSSSRSSEDSEDNYGLDIVQYEDD